VTVSRVVDGDTVGVTPAVGGNDTVRLIGVDTPERGEPLYEEAAAFAEDNLEGERVALELDAEEEDDYGRLLAYAYRSDGSMFNEALVRDGYAQVATFPPNTRYLDRFERAQEEAREAERGIWGLPEGEACQLRDRGNGIGGGC
jgi:micrococcal nuclease